MDGLSIVTVEGIGNSSKLHPCQVRIAQIIHDHYNCRKELPKHMVLNVDFVLLDLLCPCTPY